MAALHLVALVAVLAAAQAQLCRVDIVFMFDTSSSQRASFDRQRALVASLADLLHVQEGKHRVALVSYSGASYKIRRFGFEEHNSTSDFLHQLNSVPYLSGTTYTGRALGVVLDLLKTRHCSTATLLIMMTDGYTTDDITEPIKEIKDLPYLQSFAISVPDSYNERELSRLATRPEHVIVPPRVESQARSALRQLLQCDERVAERFKRPGDESKRQRAGADCAEATVDECADAGLNDCDRRATCTDRREGYTCRCPNGTVDRSGDTDSPPGRLCYLLVDECDDDRLNECHVDALCDDAVDGYACRCKPGYEDVGHPSQPGRSCAPVVDECADAALNDCDPVGGVCTDRGRPERYECRCDIGYVDRSPAIRGAPGRKCVLLVDECANALLNDCDAHAECSDLDVGYTCECPQGYKDVSPEFGSPGRKCIELVDECADAALNDCDSDGGQCLDLDEGYTCYCIAGSVDKSADTVGPGRLCETPVNECARENDCDPLARCIDTEVGFTCRCPIDTIDTSADPLAAPGRRCEPTVDECALASLNDCHSDAVCLDDVHGYLCICPDGYKDESPDKNKPGRICRHLLDECKSQSLNECDQNAVCHDLEYGYKCTCPPNSVDESSRFGAPAGRVCRLEVNECSSPVHNDCDQTYGLCVDRPTGYECVCLPGTRDVLSAIGLPPGRKCEPLTNECTDVLLNDCDRANAVCVDLPHGYTCKCRQGARDLSPDASRPGRRCVFALNECDTQLHDCSRFADCTDTLHGYECACRRGYHDNDAARPGTSCSLIIDECASANLNDCSPYADCIDTVGGYGCRCKPPYYDVSSDATRAGSDCRFDECSRPHMHQCHGIGARCVDTPTGHACVCAPGYYDDGCTSTSRVNCLPVSTSTAAPSTTVATRLPDHLMRCGSALCRRDWFEVCRFAVGSRSYQCACRSGFGRRDAGGPCVESGAPVWLPVIVSRRGDYTLRYATNVHGDPNSPTARDIGGIFMHAFSEHIGRTALSPHALSYSVESIKPPALYNADWTDGLLFNVSFTPTADSPYKSQCSLYSVLLQSLKLYGKLGNSDLHVSDGQLDVCAPTVAKCGQSVCQRQLAEVCSRNAGVCMCPAGYKRTAVDNVCRRADGIAMSVWVARRGSQPIEYYGELNDPEKYGSQQLIELFLTGIRQTYGATRLAPQFVNAELNVIEDPSKINASWHSGAMFTFTAYFKSNVALDRTDAWGELISAARVNLDELGSTNLYINQWQVDPFNKCYKSDCDAWAICEQVDGGKGYSCSCPANHTDLSRSLPGRKCQSQFNVDECSIGPNDCDPQFAACVDLPYLYRCQCLPGFKDASESDAPGTRCVRDHCYEELTCPLNSTCRTGRDGETLCTCLHGYVDIRKAGEHVLRTAGFERVWCLSPIDVDECALGLTDCASVAECDDLESGFVCRCPRGYTDPLAGDHILGGRLCSAPLCDLCNARGDCATDVDTKEVVCHCHMDYSGQYCEVAALGAATRLYIVIILAVLFLLMALCCCCFLCTRAVCAMTSGERALLMQWYRRPLYAVRHAVASSSAPFTRSAIGTDGTGLSSLVTSGTNDTAATLKIPRPLAIVPLSGTYNSDKKYVHDSFWKHDSAMARASALSVPPPADSVSSLSVSSDDSVEEQVQRRVVTTKTVRHSANATRRT